MEDYSKNYTNQLIHQIEEVVAKIFSPQKLMERWKQIRYTPKTRQLTIFGIGTTIARKQLHLKTFNDGKAKEKSRNPW